MWAVLSRWLLYRLSNSVCRCPLSLPANPTDLATSLRRCCCTGGPDRALSKMKSWAAIAAASGAVNRDFQLSPLLVPSFPILFRLSHSLTPLAPHICTLLLLLSTFSWLEASTVLVRPYSSLRQKTPQRILLSLCQLTRRSDVCAKTDLHTDNEKFVTCRASSSRTMAKNRPQKRQSFHWTLTLTLIHGREER
jgi:hypothetical protein